MMIADFSLAQLKNITKTIIRLKLNLLATELLNDFVTIRTIATKITSKVIFISLQQSDLYVLHTYAHVVLKKNTTLI